MAAYAVASSTSNIRQSLPGDAFPVTVDALPVGEVGHRQLIVQHVAGQGEGLTIRVKRYHISILSSPISILSSSKSILSS